MFGLSSRVHKNISGTTYSTIIEAVRELSLMVEAPYLVADF